MCISLQLSCVILQELEELPTADMKLPERVEVSQLASYIDSFVAIYKCLLYTPKHIIRYSQLQLCSCNKINTLNTCSYGNMQCLPNQELVELAYQLKIDVQKREKEIIELDVKVENLERDKEEKVGQLASYSILKVANQTQLCRYYVRSLIFTFRSKSVMY